MSAEQQGTLVPLDPDTPSGRAQRAMSGRAGPSRTSVGQGAAEATLSLEPLRVPIAAMVQGAVVAERELLEQVTGELGTAVEQLKEIQAREEAMRVDQTALYRQAAQRWQAASDAAVTLHARLDELIAQTQALSGIVEAASTRFWRRAMVAAWILSLAGLAMVASLCGVVWLALTQH